MSLEFDTSRNGCVLCLDGRPYRTPLVHVRGHQKKLRLTGPVRLLATSRGAIERIAPDGLKRVAANCAGAKLLAVKAPAVPQVAVLAKIAGIYARLSAFDAKALALTVLTVEDVAFVAKAAGVYARLSAFDAKGPALAMTISHVAM